MIRHRIQSAILVVVFLLAIVAANLITTHYGVSSVYYVAFGLIGLDLITRDRLADAWGTARWAKMAALIAVGGALSYFLNRHSSTIALASTVAFAGSEIAEATVYHLLRHRRWEARAPRAALLGAVVDSVVFISLAFGFSFEIVFLQVCCKAAGGLAWTWVIGHLAQPPSTAPAYVAGVTT